MADGRSIPDVLVEEAVRQIRLRPYLSGLEISQQTQENWRELIASTHFDASSPLVKFDFNAEDYKLARKDRIVSLHLRGIVHGERVQQYYEKLASMGENERRYFGRFSSEHEFDSIIQNEYVRNLLSRSPHSLFYRLNDYNPNISGSGHRKRRPLLVIESATDDEIKELMRIEQRATKKWGYSDFGK
ncbi:Uncharacterised protein [uncultured archaeon]|nr:Uncharacterised protein [uncultured archaeon]